MADCGCKLVPCDDERDKCDLCSEATGMMDGIGWRIEYCPLHQAAEKMRDALEAIVNSDHQSYEVTCRNDAGSYGIGVADGHRCAANMGREALAAAKGDKP